LDEYSQLGELNGGPIDELDLSDVEHDTADDEAKSQAGNNCAADDAQRKTPPAAKKKGLSFSDSKEKKIEDNIGRRVYDALNVQYAANVLVKVGRDFKPNY